MSSYVATTKVRSTATITDITGAAADTTMVCTVTAPDGTVTTPAVSHGATGIYYADITLSAAGEWHVVWSGSGAVVVTADDTLLVRVAGL